MQFVKSSKFTIEEALIVDRVINGLFAAINQPLDTYLPNTSVFVSKDPEEKPDYIFNIDKFSSCNFELNQSLELINLFSSIFPDVYIEPRYLLASYQQVMQTYHQDHNTDNTPTQQGSIESIKIDSVINNISEQITSFNKENFDIV
jgi:hypothetical protein